jgi:hypothetical protein
MALRNRELPGLDQLRTELHVAFRKHRSNDTSTGVAILPEMIEHPELGPEARRIAAEYGYEFVQVDEDHYLTQRIVRR